MTMPEGDDDGQPEAVGSQRLDKWLWFARVVKTRTLAAKLVVEGKVRLNRARTDKPAQAVKPGDVLTIAVHAHVRVLRVRLPGDRRGPSVEAATLFEDLTPPRDPKAASGPLSTGREKGSGRPTKRERRQIDDLKGGG
jgi:ribosome-associated heat shock protein Hsp15